MTITQEDRETAERMQQMAEAILAAIVQQGGVSNMQIVLGALSSVAGALAMSCNRPPTDFLVTLLETANLVVKSAQSKSKEEQQQNASHH